MYLVERSLKGEKISHRSQTRAIVVGTSPAGQNPVSSPAQIIEDTSKQFF